MISREITGLQPSADLEGQVGAINKGKGFSPPSFPILVGAILDPFAEPICVLDDKGKIRYANPSFLHLPQEDLKAIAQTLAAPASYHPGNNAVTDAIEFRMASRKVTAVSNEGPFYQLNTYPFPWEDGTKARVMVQDITWLQMEIFNFRHAVKTVVMACNSAVHDLKNDLTPPRGFVQLAAKFLGIDNVKAAQYLEIANRSLIKAVETAKHIPAQIEAAGELRIGKFDIVNQTEELASQLVEMARGAYDNLGNLSLTFTTSTPSQEIEGDPQALASVAGNLMLNAIQEMDESPNPVKVLSVIITTSETYVTIYIKDTGRGIPPEKLPSLFFESYSDKQTGNGIGLPDIYNKVKAHKGFLEVEETGNMGTTFKIVLPIAHFSK